MRALAVLGTYRKQGIISSAAAAVLRGAAAAGAATETVFLADQRIGYCRNCRACTQAPGDEPGRCGQEDDVAGLVQRVAACDLLILGSPTNLGSATAVTKTFAERLAPLFRWSWGEAMPARRAWLPPGRMKAVLLTSSLAPALVGRVLRFSVLDQLRDLAHAFGAEVVAERYYGGAAKYRDSTLSTAQLDDARTLGERVISGHLPRLRWPDLGYQTQRLAVAWSGRRGAPPAGR